MSKTAIILAAGLGSRLKPLTTDMPKCLTEIGDRPILGRQLYALRKAGFDRVVVVVGYLKNKVVDYLNNYRTQLEIETITNPDYATTGTAYSLWLARDYLKDGALVVEGDVVFNELPNKFSKDSIVWFGRLANQGDDGCIFWNQGASNIVGMSILSKPLIIKNPWLGQNPDLWKSAGIHWIPKNCEYLLNRLNTDIVRLNKKNKYKDLYFGDCLTITSSNVLSIIHLFEGWHEIDTYQDVLEAERGLTQTKNVVVILDGMEDRAYKEFMGMTPLNWAKMPNLDRLIDDGSSFKIQTMYPNLPLGSVVAMIGLLGYNPHRYYPFGRASFEAIAHGVNIEPGQTALRCNVVQVDNEVIVGNEPRGIGQAPVVDMMEQCGMDDRIVFIQGQSYRNLLIVDDDLTGLELKEPHRYFGQSIDKLYSGNHLIDDFMLSSLDYFDDCLMLVPWSPSTKPYLPSFTKRWGMDGAVVTAMDFLAGIGKCARMEVHQVGTGDTDTNLQDKLVSLKQALWFNDIVFLHINALDELSHRKDLYGKVGYLEMIDEQVIKPMVDNLEREYSDKFRLLIMADHATYADTGQHGDENVNCIIYGKECGLHSGKTIQSFELMEYLREGER